MKNVKSFSNSDNTHCLQACVKSVIDYLVPTFKVPSDQELDKFTGHFGDGFPWLPHTVCWFNDLGLHPKLISVFDYNQFSLDGLKYMQGVRSPKSFKTEKDNGDYLHVPEIQKVSVKMVKLGLWTNEYIDENQLSVFLKKKNTLAIAKTKYGLIHNNPNDTTAHFVLLIEPISYSNYRIHDPGGVRPYPNYYAPIAHTGAGIFSDVLIVEN